MVKRKGGEIKGGMKRGRRKKKEGRPKRGENTHRTQNKFLVTALTLWNMHIVLYGNIITFSNLGTPCN